MKGRLILAEMSRAARAALVIDGRIEDLLIDPADPAIPIPGDIYRGKVDRLMPSMGGAFLRLTAEHQGFLREIKGVKSGTDILVQITGEAEPGKAIPVTRRPLLKSRRLILTPGAPGINISRSIKNLEVREALGTVTLDADDTGLILRTASRAGDPAQLTAEARDLLMRWRGIEAGGAGRLWRMNAVQTALCEWTDPLPDAIHSVGLPQEAFENEAELRDLIHDTEPDPFERFGVLEEIATLAHPGAPLPSGGSIYVENTRACVVIDVNASDGSPMTANVEAARELPRQLRLRGLGGQIVVDFAPLKKMHRRKIEEVLKAAFRRDPVDTQLVGWTPLGHFELSRKRERRPLADVT